MKASNNSNNKKVFTQWSGHGNDLFLIVQGDELRLLDYENDTREIHRLAGGKVIYESVSGMTGDGFIEDLSALIPIGGYRVDTTYDGWTYGPAVKVANGLEVEVYAPTWSHATAEDYKEILRKFPLLVRRKVYGVVELFLLPLREGKETLSRIFAGEEWNLIAGNCDEIRTVKLEKEFYRNDVKDADGHPWAVHRYMTVYDGFFSPKGERMPNLWGYYGDLKKEDSVMVSRDALSDLEKAFRIEVVDDGVYYLKKIAGQYYRTGYSERNPLFDREEFQESISSRTGWKWISDRVACRFNKYSQEISIFSWDVSGEPLAKKAKRFATKNFSAEEAERFLEWLPDAAKERYWGRFLQHEERVAQPLFVLKRSAFIAKVRKGLAEDADWRLREAVEAFRSEEKGELGA